MRLTNLSCIGSALILVLGCGGDDDDKGGGGGSYEAVAESIANPTGTLDATNARGVAEEFEQLSTANPGGTRQLQAQSGSTTIPCSGGGDITATGSGSQSSGSVVAVYNACCEGGCCTDGTADTHVSAAGDATYTACISYDITAECAGVSTSVQFDGCIGASGSFVYVIDIEGQTFAVTGAVSSGTGTLEITGANGTFTCTYADYAGTCTDSAGAEFTF